MFELPLDDREDIEVLSDLLELQRLRSSGNAPAVDEVIDKLYARVQIQLLLLDVGTEAAVVVRASRKAPPCPCACNSNGFCGGCGHAGCGGRRW